MITRLDRGGSADNTLLSCIGQCRNGHEVTLVTGEGMTQESALAAEAERAGVTLVRIPALVRAIRPWKDLAALWACFRLIRRGRFDIVHTHTSKAGIIGRVAARLAGGCRLVHTPHGHVFYGYFGPFLSRLFIWIERLMAPWTDAIVTLTDREAQEHLELGVGRPSQFVAIFSGVALSSRPLSTSAEERAAHRRALGLSAEGTMLVSVGRLDPVKGHDVLIRALARLKEKHPDAYLVLVGDGESRGAYEKLAVQLGVGEAIHFLGWREDVHALLAAADLFALPSLNEGMGRAVVEAMAMGLAVVASRVGGMPEIVEHGRTGLLVPHSDPEALAATISDLLSHPERRETMGREGRLRALGFSTEIMCEKLETLYQSVLSSPLSAQAAS